MDVKDAVSTIETHRLVAVVRAKTSEQALRASYAAIEGGIRLIELTFTVPDAPSVIKQLIQEVKGDVLIGAGSVIRSEQAIEALEAGARFIVSPIKQLDLVQVSHQAGAPCILGGLTPTEIVEGHRAGADQIKIFPIALVGGPSFIKELLAPLPDLPIMVSGGINLENFRVYLAAGARSVALGGSLIQSGAIEAGDYRAITRLARQFQEALASWRETHK